MKKILFTLVLISIIGCSTDKCVNNTEQHYKINPTDADIAFSVPTDEDFALPFDPICVLEIRKDEYIGYYLYYNNPDQFDMDTMTGYTDDGFITVYIDDFTADAYFELLEMLNNCPDAQERFDLEELIYKTFHLMESDEDASGQMYYSLRYSPDLFDYDGYEL